MFLDTAPDFSELLTTTLSAEEAGRNDKGIGAMLISNRCEEIKGILEDSTLEERAEQLYLLLLEVEAASDDLTDEQFCGLVHQAVTAFGFRDALDAWTAMLEVTERRIALIDFRDLPSRSCDLQN